jgi:GMP synthase-like glutamine amidotransferase
MIERTGDYDRIFGDILEARGFDVAAWPVVDMLFPPDAAAADGWLITGSKYGAYDDLPWIAPLENLIRDIHARRLALIGVCFGHQIIAQALGGRVEKFTGGWAVGHTEYQGVGGPLAVNAWHQDQVVRAPEGARVLASNAFCENAVLAYGDHIWTIQPHPEFDARFVADLARLRGRGVVPDALLDGALARCDQPTDNDAIADHWAAFFRKARA